MGDSLERKDSTPTNNSNRMPRQSLTFSPTEVSIRTITTENDETGTTFEEDEIGLRERRIEGNFYRTPSQENMNNEVALLQHQVSTVTQRSMVDSAGDDGNIAKRYSVWGESKSAKQALISALSALYAMVLIIMSLGFEVSYIVVESVSPYNYDFFYIYLYSMALLFLGYCYAFLLKNDSGLPRKPFSWRSWSRSASTMENGQQTTAKIPDEFIKMSTRVAMSMKRKITYSAEGAGSLYLRLGCVVFGVVGLISKGLHIFSAFDGNKVACIQASTIAETALSGIFIFVQMFFVFENSKLVIHRFKSIASIGLMHLIATNLCMWIRNLVEEQFSISSEYTEKGSREGRHFINSSELADAASAILDPQHALSMADHAASSIEVATDLSTHSNCPSSIGGANTRHAVGALLSDVRPFMITCVIEYSLICSATMYILWRHIGRMPKLRIRQRKQRFHVDCSSSTKGLFVGLLFMVFTIITMLIFFTKLRSGRDHEALWIFYATDTFLYTVSVTAIVIAACRLRKLYYMPIQHEVLLLDDILLIVGLLGQLIFCVFSIVPLHTGSLIAGLLVVTSMLRMIEVLLQTLFIFFGQRLSTMNSTRLRDANPGRELITFLLMTNLSMFLINTFETQKAGANPLMYEFYGKGIWTVIVHSTTPLCIFYRFHSTVCLAEIWKSAYRIKDSGHGFTLG